MREVGGVNLVHGGEVVHAGEEDVHLDIINIETFEYLGKIPQRTLTIFATELPAPSRMALMFSQQALVMSPMPPSTILPDASAGSWPGLQGDV